MQSVNWYYIYTDSHTESLCQFLDKFVCQFINMNYCIFFPLFANLYVTNIWPRLSTHDPDSLSKSRLIQNVDKEYVTTCYRNPSLVVCMMTRGTNDPFVVEGGPVKVNRSFPSWWPPPLHGIPKFLFSLMHLCHFTLHYVHSYIIFISIKQTPVFVTAISSWLYPDLIFTDFTSFPMRLYCRITQSSLHVHMISSVRQNTLRIILQKSGNP